MGNIRIFLAYITFFSCVFIGITVADDLVCPADKTKHWTYRRDLLNGPEHWKDTYSDCGGELQSPINIDTSNVVEGPSQTLQLKNFDIPISDIIIYNTGTYISFTPIDEVSRTATLDGVEYVLQTFHFHWGNDTGGTGSEHAIDGKKFPMEAHFIMPSSNGPVLELASILDLNDEMNPALENILFVKPQYQYYGDTFQGKIQRDYSDPKRQGKIYLEDILDLKCPYYHYRGSFGIPPCTENAIWAVCKTKKNVNISQLQQLYTINTVKTKTIDDEHDCTMKNVWRPLQNLNHRTVYG